MNVFVYKLSESDDRCVRTEDNVGESIHVHYNDLRLEYSIESYLKLTNNLEKSIERLEEWE